MIKSKFFRYLLFVYILCFSFSAEAALSPKKQLNEVLHKIQNVKSSLTETQKKQTEVREQLKQSEVKIGVIAVKAKQTSKKLNNEKTHLENLKIEQANYLAKFMEQRRHVLREMRADYMLGHDSYVKMLLNQENSANVDRYSVYYHYLFDYRSQIILDTKAILEKLDQSNKAVAKQTVVLQTIYTKEQQERQELEKERLKRDASLKTLHTTFENQNSNLQKLLQDKQALEELIIRLSAIEKRTPFQRAFSGKSLSALRGKLLSPTGGKLQAGSGEARLNGVLIASPEGTEVHGGRHEEGENHAPLIFADWLRGYGLLLIIDHGHGYMSLYGRNHSLYKKTGDSVDVGEAISTVGASGGYDTPALYFAMRKNGKPIDPSIWCRF